MRLHRRIARSLSVHWSVSARELQLPWTRSRSEQPVKRDDPLVRMPHLLFYYPYAEHCRDLAGNSLGGLDPLELMPLTSLLYLYVDTCCDHTSNSRFRNLSNAGLGRLGNEPFKGLNIAILYVYISPRVLDIFQAVFSCRDLSHNGLSDDDLLCVSFQGMNPTLTYLYR